MKVNNEKLVTLPSEDRRKIRLNILSYASLTLIIGGVIILWTEFQGDQYPAIKETLRRIGDIVVTTGVVTALYELLSNARYLAIIQDLFGRELEPIRKEVPKLEDGIDKLQKTVEIASGAIESGITAVYANRLDALEQIRILLTRIPVGQIVKIVGISLGDFLCPHGYLYATVRGLLSNTKDNAQFQMLIIDHLSEVARQRARREEPSYFSTGKDEYAKTRCNNELKTASDVAEDYQKQYPDRFEYRKYQIAPLCFVIILGDTMFMESYHYAGRGGEAPVLRIVARPPGSPTKSRLFEIYENHFSALWNEQANRANNGAAKSVVTSIGEK